MLLELLPKKAKNALVAPAALLADAAQSVCESDLTATKKAETARKKRPRQCGGAVESAHRGPCGVNRGSSKDSTSV